MLWGCTQEKQQTEAPVAKTVSAVEQGMDAVKKETGAVVQQVEKTTEAAAKKTEQKIAVVEKKIAEKAAPVIEKSEEIAARLKPAPAKRTTSIESINIDNKNGTVVLPHKKHAEAFGCAACHGDKEPGPQKLGKDTAHALCQGCHKERKSGPTACNQCHQKKAKALEGC